MNYFAHGRRFIDEPWRLAGTAVPDWLNVSDRGVRIRSKRALLWVGDADPRVAALARGIVQHHEDDAWFHQSAAFTEASWRVTRMAREALPSDDASAGASFRPSFLGHILVEILLDAQLIDEAPARLEAYYAAVASLDGPAVERAVNVLAVRPCRRLAQLLPLFAQERFLSDYADDEKLLRRLNQVMRRVTLPELPETFVQIFPDARRLVGEFRESLLAGHEV